jgi:hypothetical protein
MMKKLIVMLALLFVISGEVALGETSFAGEPITVAATSDANSASQPRYRRGRRHTRRRRHNRRRHNRRRR